MVKLLLFLTIAVGIASADVRPIPGGRIVGGYEVDIEEYPWQVSLQKNGRHICGGSILNKHWILTAAHCVHQEPARVFSFRVGSSFHATGGHILKAEKIIEHPKYHAPSSDYDVALVRVEKSIPLNGKTIVAARLAEIDHSVKGGDPLRVTGWGYTKEGGPLSKELRGVIVPVVGHEECNKAYRNRITDRMVCAGFIKKGGKDSCQGDSGGPLVDRDNVQIGVVSWGQGCARPGLPGVYANVAEEEIRLFILLHTGL